MDGSKRKVVVSRDLSWPVGLTFDLLDSRVYWADEKLRCIGSTSLDGENVKVTRKKTSRFHSEPGNQPVGVNLEQAQIRGPS